MNYSVATTSTDPSREAIYPVVINQHWPKMGLDPACSIKLECRSVAGAMRDGKPLPEVAQMAVEVFYRYPKQTRSQLGTVLLDRLAARALRDELNRALGES